MEIVSYLAGEEAALARVGREGLPKQTLDWVLNGDVWGGGQRRDRAVSCEAIDLWSAQCTRVGS